MYGKTELDRLRFRIVRLYDSLYDVSSSFDVSLQDAAAALNAGIAANAGALLNVSNSLSVSLEDAKNALQAGLEANAGALINVSSSLSVSLEEAKNALQFSLQANASALLDVSSSLSTSLSESAEALRLALGANISAVIQLSQSTSSSLSASAAALREGLIAVGGTIVDVSSSLSTSLEESGRLLRKSLTDLVNQNSESFKSRVDGLDGQVDGVLDDVKIVTDDLIIINNFTSSTKTDLGDLKDFKSTANSDLGDLKNFKNSNISKLAALAAEEKQQNDFVTANFSLAASFVKYKAFSYTSLYSWISAVETPPNNYWAYTVSYPTGTNPFYINSYSYMGTYAGTKYWNLEEIISYSKREYVIKDGSFASNLTYGAFDTNNTMVRENNGDQTSAKINKASELSLKADKIILRKGSQNSVLNSVEIVGETAETNGTDLNQGQLFIRDEDSTTSGLQIGYRYQLLNSYVDERGNTINDIAQYGRIQAVKSNGATDLYLNPAGGSVRIGRLNDSYLTEGTIELNYYGYGNRNSFIDFHSDNTYGRPGSNNTAPTDGDYSGRIIRWSGVNGMMEIVNRGTGGIRNTVINGTGNIFDWYVGDSRLMYLSSGGNLTIAGAYAPSSDERIKTDILTSSLGLEFINNLNPVQFKFIVADEIIDITKEKLENNKIVNDGSRKAGVRNHFGFIAQEVKKAAGNRDFAAVIYEPEKDLYKLNHQEFISPMVKAIQELSTENDYLKSKLEEKDKQINDILSRLAVLENK